MGDRVRFASVPLLAVTLLFAFSLVQAVAANNFPDFFIYRAGAVLGLSGHSPYDDAQIRARVAQQFPDALDLIANCGFFLPPSAVAVFSPFAVVDYATAKVLWAVAMGLSALGAVQVLRVFSPPVPPSLIGSLAAVVLLLNPLTLAVVVVGQTTLLFAGCVSGGQWCFERGRPVLGAVLWAIPFVKPHLALPLIPLAWYLGGWKRAAAVVGAVAGLNLIGCLTAGGSLLFFREYLEFLASAHKTVVFNRAELNPQITSWNRLLISLGGPVVELTAITTLAGYAVWFSLVIGRCAMARMKPSPAWAMAAAVVGGLLCCQVLGYELVVLVLVVPWIREQFAGGWRVRGWLAVLLLAGQLLPREAFAPLGWESHRSLGVALLALLVLAGPITRGSSNPAPDSARPRE